MKYQKGLVSVIMPTYRDTVELNRAIDSVLAQTYPHIECILINDNTPDDEYSQKLYQKIARYRQDPRFVFLEQPEHINGAAARNYGIARAKGEYIAFLDDDDWWKPEKIEKQVQFLEKQGPECGGVSTLVEYYDGEEAVRWMRPYEDGKITRQILRREVDVNTGTFMARHEALDDAGYFDISLKRHQEIQLLTFFTDKYEIRLLPEYLMCYNVGSNYNAPSADRLRQIKQDFFASVEPVLRKFKKSEVKRIKALHRFELAYAELKEKKYKLFIRDAFAVAKNPRTLWLALRRVRQRRKEFKKPC